MPKTPKIHGKLLHSAVAQFDRVSVWDQEHFCVSGVDQVHTHSAGVQEMAGQEQLPPAELDADVVRDVLEVFPCASTIFSRFLSSKLLITDSFPHTPIISPPHSIFAAPFPPSSPRFSHFLIPYSHGEASCCVYGWKRCG